MVHDRRSSGAALGFYNTSEKFDVLHFVLRFCFTFIIGGGGMTLWHEHNTTLIIVTLVQGVRVVQGVCVVLNKV